MKYPVYNNIRHLREDNDLTQTQLAKLLNIAQNTYSQYECGRIALTSDVLIKLAGYYGVSVDYLLGLTKERLPYPKN